MSRDCAVLLQELTYWTGYSSRLAYTMAELAAELGAAFLCADLDITNAPHPDHAAYVASWLGVLRKDPGALFTAASKASAATEYLSGQARSSRLAGAAVA